MDDGNLDGVSSVGDSASAAFRGLLAGAVDLCELAVAVSERFRAAMGAAACLDAAQVHDCAPLQGDHRSPSTER